MRIIPFPSQRQPPGQEAWNADLDAALAGELRGPTAEAWRELREDVRSLAQPMTPAFEARLREELERRGALGESAAQAEAPPRRRSRLGLARRRSLLLGATAAAVAALALALALATPPGSRSPSGTPGSSSSAARAQNAPASGATASGRADEMGASPAPTASALSTARAAGAAAPSPSGSGEAGSGGAPGRVQQLAASITLSAAPESVQAVSDQVAQIAVHDGGYVQTSNVRVQQQRTSASAPGGEATLALRLPSARLGAALAAIGRLSPVRAQGQSLEDITNSYDAAHQQLNDALVERQALLHALAAATTEGQIDSLRERLAENRGAITRAQASVNSVSRRASTAEVEVSVLGDQHNSGTSGLSLHSGLHDAERVLVAVVSALLIALAALVPLGLVLAALLGARRAWRRVQRERALDAT
jgi:Domain of unknown function (DUF4349)